MMVAFIVVIVNYCIVIINLTNIILGVVNTVNSSVSLCITLRCITLSTTKMTADSDDYSDDIGDDDNTNSNALMIITRTVFIPLRYCSESQSKHWVRYHYQHRPGV